MYRTWSERASAACSVSRFGSGKGGPEARRSRLHNARVNGAVFDAPLSAWQAVKRSLVREWLRQEFVRSSVACAWLASSLCRVASSPCCVARCVASCSCVGVCARACVGVCVCVRVCSLRTCCVMRSLSACAYVPMRLKLPAYNARVVFRRLGSRFPRENRAFRSFTYGK